MILRYTVLGLIALAGLILAPSLVLSERWGLAMVVVAGALLWGMGFWRGVQWPTGLGVAVCSGAAALGIYDGNALWLMIASILIALVAWDMGFFLENLDEAEALDVLTLYRTHFTRLGIILVGGLVLSGLMFAFQWTMRPVWAIILGVFVIFGLSRTVRFLRQESD